MVHRESHLPLTHPVALGSRRTVDAVVVPAGRSAAHVKDAAQLAGELGCVLLAMCSRGGADPADFAEVRARLPAPPTRWYQLTVPDDYRHPLLPASSTPDAAPGDSRHRLLSTMRNLALVVARMVGWRTVLLLDDDIRGLDRDVVERAAGELERDSAVAFPVTSYPDHSVVCHANLLTGRRQRVFVSGSALLVDVGAPFSFFPNIYNDDWFHLYDDVSQDLVGRVSQAGLRQLHYDPYLLPWRPATEELGEVLAEGLMGALHEWPPRFAPDGTAYWADVLAAREDFLAGITARLHRLEPGPQQQRALLALQVAEARRRRITPVQCAEYVGRWRADVQRWRRAIAALDREPGVDAAADRLDLRGTLVGSSRR